MKLHLKHIIPVAILAAAALCLAQQSQPAGDVTPQTKLILDRLQTAGDKYTTLTADVDYTVEMRMTGETENRTGWVAFQKSTDKMPDMFRIHFDTLKLDQGKKTVSQLDYIFDGQWLTIAKHNIKSMTRMQVAQPGEKVEALRIGKGPFPVPFGQKTDDMIKCLQITTREPSPDDPKNTDYLKLIPRKDYEDQLNFRKMEMWIDRDTNLPVKVVVKDKNKNVTTAGFSNIKTQTQIDPALFVMEKTAGWDLTIERMNKTEKPRGRP